MSNNKLYDAYTIYFFPLPFSRLILIEFINYGCLLLFSLEYYIFGLPILSRSHIPGVFHLHTEYQFCFALFRYRFRYLPLVVFSFVCVIFIQLILNEVLLKPPFSQV